MSWASCELALTGVDLGVYSCAHVDFKKRILDKERNNAVRAVNDVRDRSMQTIDTRLSHEFLRCRTRTCHPAQNECRLNCILGTINRETRQRKTASRDFVRKLSPTCRAVDWKSNVTDLRSSFWKHETRPESVSDTPMTAIEMDRGQHRTHGGMAYSRARRRYARASAFLAV